MIGWLQRDDQSVRLHLNSRNQGAENLAIELDRLRAIGWALLMSALLLDGCDDGLFDLAGRDPRDRAKPGCSGLSMNAGLRHIIAIADACLGGVGCDHAMAGIVEQQVPEEVVRLLPGQGLMGLMGRQLVLHRLKQALVDDRRLFPRQDLAPVVDLANEEPVAEEMGEGAPAKGNAAAGVAGAFSPWCRCFWPRGRARVR